MDAAATWLSSDDRLGYAYRVAFTGSVRTGEGRGMLWRSFLGVLPLPPKGSAEGTGSDAEDSLYDAWCAALDVARKELPAAEAARECNPPQSGDDAGRSRRRARDGPRFGDESDSDSSSGGDVAPVDDPLARNKNGQWEKYFARQKILELIDKDLGRLWSGEDFFEDDEVKGHIRCVLESLLDGGVVTDYAQGMHELVSMIYWVLRKDADAVSSATGNYMDCVKVACSMRYLAHDTYALAARLLRRTDGLGGAALYNACAEPVDETKRGVVWLCAAIQGPMLAAADRELSDHLSQLEIEPVVYGLRWLRLLFLREFPFPQVAKLWDAIFAEHRMTGTLLEESLAPHIAVSMLLFIAGDLREQDYAMALRRLMKYPPVEDVAPLLQRAIELKYGRDGALWSLTHASGPFSAAVAETEPMALVPEPSAPLPQRMGQALGVALEKLNGRWFPQPDATVSEGEYLLAIAELKRIRDVLLGDLPDE